MLGHSASTPRLNTSAAVTSSDASKSDKDELKIERKFTSNLCAVLNDPRKDRTKINYLFTKTWGNEFIDNPVYPSIYQLNPKYAALKSLEFRDYLGKIGNVRTSVHLSTFADHWSLIHASSSNRNTNVTKRTNWT